MIIVYWKGKFVSAIAKLQPRKTEIWKEKKLWHSINAHVLSIIQIFHVTKFLTFTEVETTFHHTAGMRTRYEIWWKRSPPLANSWEPFTTSNFWILLELTINFSHIQNSSGQQLVILLNWSTLNSVPFSFANYQVYLCKSLDKVLSSVSFSYKNENTH